MHKLTTQNKSNAEREKMFGKYYTLLFTPSQYNRDSFVLALLTDAKIYRHLLLKRVSILSRDSVSRRDSYS